MHGGMFFRNDICQLQDRSSIFEKRRRELANKAVALDPSLTWIYFEIHQDAKINSDAALEAARQLQNWDPNNAVASLASADVIFEQESDGWVKAGHGYDFSMAQPKL